MRIGIWLSRIGLGVFLLFAVSVASSFVTPTNRYFEIVKNLDIFASLFKEVNEYYVDDINPGQLMNKGVDEMLNALDPYTDYISEDKIESFRTLNTGQYAGIGASTVTIDDHIYVSMVYEGFSGYDKGLRIGDEIIKVDNIALEGLSRERINELVKGQAKTIINLTVNGIDGQKGKEISFEREKVSIPNVPYSGMLDNNVGYIKFTEFTPNGYKNIKKALQKLMKDGATGLVLDLRGNLGGLLKEAVDISNLFIESDLEVVNTKGKNEANNYTYKTQFNPLTLDLPLVILVDNMSASASEIVAGTLQDYDRAVLVGQKTFGKGLVQNTRNLPYNSMVKMTIAKYYIPSGRCIQAVDYSHRNPDGSIGKMPDSLKTAFKTKNGRRVYDGGGIDPEIVMETEPMSQFARQLISEGYIFKYANEYKKVNPKIAPARAFNLDDDAYADFGSYLSKENFEFKNPLNSDLDVLVKKVDELKASGQLDEALLDIENTLKAPLDEIVALHKDEIKKLLETEIASRYYLQPGAIEASLGDDKSIDQAIAILSDAEGYSKLLTDIN